MPVYFDNNANAPVLPEILEAMLPSLRGELGNASSIHRMGQAAKRALEAARENVADLIAAQPSEIVFTSGGTESDNLAIRGILANAPADRRHIVTTRIEHHAVLNVFEQLEKEGFDVAYVRPDSTGRVPASAVLDTLRPDTALVSVMLANNETGVLQPIPEIAAATRERKIPFHVDAIQAVGRAPVAVRTLGCDLLSLSGHKIHAPSGVGALYVRRGVRLAGQQLGGHHERDRRAGTENLPGIVGLGAAAALVSADLPVASARMAALRDRLEAAVCERIPGTAIVGAGAPRVPNTANICFENVEGEALVIALDLLGFCVSTGAACSSGALEPSHVLLAMGFSKARARSCLRFSLGRQNTSAEVAALIEALPAAVAKLRELSSAGRDSGSDWDGDSRDPRPSLSLSGARGGTPRWGPRQ